MASHSDSKRFFVTALVENRAYCCVGVTLTRLPLIRIYRASLITKLCLSLLCTVSLLALAQDVPPPPNRVFLRDQVVAVKDLPVLKAPSEDASAVLATALETVLHDKDVCCGKYSSLGDAVLSAASLKELSPKLEGRHVLGDGRSIMVHAEYFPQSPALARPIVKTLMDQQSMLLEWNSRVYVLYGANFDEIRQYNPDDWMFTIRKFSLLDVRFSDQRRAIEFNSQTDDWKAIQGVMRVSVVRP